LLYGIINYKLILLYILIVYNNYCFFLILIKVLEIQNKILFNKNANYIFIIANVNRKEIKWKL